jgi:hypothetical protein
MISVYDVTPNGDTGFTIPIGREFYWYDGNVLRQSMLEKAGEKFKVEFPLEFDKMLEAIEEMKLMDMDYIFICKYNSTYWCAGYYSEVPF